MKNTPWLVLISTLLFSFGCAHAGTIEKCIEGTGIAKSETRQTGPFNAIDAAGAFDVTVVCGQKRDVKVIADGNLLPHIITQVRDATLHIYADESICAKKQLKVEIATDTVTKIAASGAADIDVSSLDNQRFALEISGSGDVKTSGKTTELVADLSGAANLRAKNLKTLKTTLTISGSGDAVVFASQELNARLVGVGNITYFGNPGKISKNVLGVGDIESGE